MGSSWKACNQKGILLSWKTVSSRVFSNSCTTVLTSITEGTLCYQQFPLMGDSSTATLLKARSTLSYSIASFPACWIKWPHFRNPILSSSWTTAEYTKTLMCSISSHHGVYILRVLPGSDLTMTCHLFQRHAI